MFLFVSVKCFLSDYHTYNQEYFFFISLMFISTYFNNHDR